MDSMHHSEHPDSAMIRRLREVEQQNAAKVSEALQPELDKLAKAMELGATGQYPEGKLTDADEGEIKIAVGIAGGKVVVQFGKPVAWLGLTAQQARQLAESLRQQSHKL
jgi:hypothetical protein